MPFEFNCPQGHLLSAEPSQAGQLVQCPMCQTQFAIPAPPAAAAAPPPTPPPAAAPPRSAPPPPAPPPPPGMAMSGAAAPGMGFGADDDFDPLAGIDDLGGGDDMGANDGDFGGGGFGDIDVFSIPCPNGHILETPAEMLGQYAMCPHCQAQFELREKDSEEYKERRKRELERQDAIVGEKWLKRSIWIAVVVVVGLLILMIVNITSG